MSRGPGALDFFGESRPLKGHRSTHQSARNAIVAAGSAMSIPTSSSPSHLPSRQANWSMPTCRAAGHRGHFICMGRLLLCCPEGTSENSPAFQRWVGPQKVASPEGTAEACLRRKTRLRGRQVQSHTSSFSRPFGTCVPGGMSPGVKTPGYSQDVLPGQRNEAAAFCAEQATNSLQL